jgi:hypothetical protein
MTMIRSLLVAALICATSSAFAQRDPAALDATNLDRAWANCSTHIRAPSAPRAIMQPTEPQSPWETGFENCAAVHEQWRQSEADKAAQAAAKKGSK